MATQTAGTLSPEEEQKKALEDLSISKYNKVLSQLTPEERNDLFRSYKSERATAQGFANDPTPQGKNVSNGRIYVAPTWSENLAHATKVGMGAYQNSKLNSSEQRGRQTAAKLAASESDLAEQRRQEQLKREDERFQAILSSFGTR